MGMYKPDDKKFTRNMQSDTKQVAQTTNFKKIYAESGERKFQWT